MLPCCPTSYGPPITVAAATGVAEVAVAVDARRAAPMAAPTAVAATAARTFVAA